MAVIETRDLWKTYGLIEALKGVSIRVEPGEIYGLLGQNGAGKTTLIKIMLGIVHKTSGDATLLGAPAGSVDVRTKVGYLPEDHQFPGYHTGYSLMDFYGQLYGLSRDDRQRKIPEMLEMVGIRNRMDSRIRTYSKGMKQRLGIAQAMFHNPTVIFLDEPTDGVDPVGRREIRDMMERLKADGKTVFLNSHLLGEVEAICDRVAILSKGELARQGTVAELTRQVNRFVIGLAPNQTFPTSDVAQMGYTVEPAVQVEVVLPEGKGIDPVLALLQSKGLNLRHLVEKKQSLEDVFVQMVDAEDPGTDRRAALRPPGRRLVRTEEMTVQFLAFLKDSYREAKSGWMLQIMLVLSGLLVLLVLSIGFRPVTLQDELNDRLSLLTRIAATNPEGGKPQLGIDNVTSSNPAEPWKADYTFDYVIKCDSPEDMKKALDSGMPVTREDAEQFLRGTLSFLKNVEVTGGPPELEKSKRRGDEPKGKDKDKDKDAAKDKDKDAKDPPLPKEVRYKVTTKGTKVDDRLARRHKVSVLFIYEIPYFYTSLREGVYVMEKYLVNGAGSWVLLFVAIVITAGFIPSMLAKGSLDLMVSKPIGRTRLLIYKYVGGLTFVLILTTATVVGVWLAIGVRSGIWSPNFLAIIPILTFYFAVLYAVSTTVAVFTRNTLVAILLTGVAWGALWVVGKVNDGIENRREQEAKAKPINAGTPEAVLREVESDQPLWGFIPKSIFTPVTALHFLTPRTYQLDDRLGRVIAEGVLTPSELKAKEYDTPPRTSWAEMVLVSLFGIGALLGLAAWRFGSRDY